MAEGLQFSEINDRAAIFEPPFDISRQQLYHYRKTRHVKITELIQEWENKALSRGLARKEIRVLKLQKLAQKIEKDLFQERTLWLENCKGVGSGDIAEIYYYEEFNKSEVDAYRGVLDDIAKEMGGRVHKTEVMGEDGGPVIIQNVTIGGIDIEEDI